MNCEFKMASRILCQVCCVLMTVTDKIQESESTLHLEPIQFAISNRNWSAVTLGLDASVTQLHHVIAESYNVSFPFELQLSGETIVSPQSLTNRSLADIPSIVSIAKDLDDFYGSGFRIPLQIHPMTRESSTTDSEMTALASLAQMFGGNDTNIHQFEWYRFVLHCLESRACGSEMLCQRFGKLFFCEDSAIQMINLKTQPIRGHLDLAAIPRTVNTINLQRNLLTKIIGFDQLAGKELMSLDIRKNPLEIDLNQLRSTSRSSGSYPLKTLQVNFNQISQSLIGKYYEPTDPQSSLLASKVYQAARGWIESSTLNTIVIGWHPRPIQRQRRT